MTTWIHEQRLATVHQAVLDTGARRVLDLGCGEGDLLLRLMHESRFDRLVGVDLSEDALDRLRSRLAEQTGPPATCIELVHASMIEPLQRFRGSIAPCCWRRSNISIPSACRSWKPLCSRR
ncbi:methyltransferase domain-containing protein [Fodinicurvata halophila]|uniref:methyltransferase domain-containing protein n=1 Tax=Fodinicurvata halophila TaxID=1419723 RepID=UPI0036436B04